MLRKVDAMSFAPFYRLYDLQASVAMKVVPHNGWLRRRLEAAILVLAAWIIDGRNVQRPGVVSRRDNNDTRYMAEKLEDIADRIKRQYP